MHMHAMLSCRLPHFRPRTKLPTHATDCERQQKPSACQLTWMKVQDCPTGSACVPHGLHALHALQLLVGRALVDVLLLTHPHSWLECCRHCCSCPHAWSCHCCSPALWMPCASLAVGMLLVHGPAKAHATPRCHLLAWLAPVRART